MNNPAIITGGNHADHRGSITFFNEFDMSPIKRFYIIENKNLEVKRGWRGHKIEQRWFYVERGTFKIELVKITDWLSPDPKTYIAEYILTDADNQILHIPAGYATCLQCLEPKSKVFVYADHDLDHAKNDDYLYPEDYFK